MGIRIPSHSEKVLNEFASKQWNKTIAFLRSHFGIDDEGCKDVFQEAFVVLHKNNLEGKLNEMSSSLSTYFIGICKNKALEYIRHSPKSVNVEHETTFDLCDSEIKQDKVNALLDKFDEDDSAIKEKKESLVRQIVSELPPPCNELLWGFFRDNFSMKTLAEMYGYSSENVVKVTKHRCQNKFSERFNSLKQQLYS